MKRNPFTIDRNISTTRSTFKNRKFDWDLSVFLWLAFGIIGITLNTAEVVQLIRKRRCAIHFRLHLLSLGLADIIGCLAYCLYAFVMISVYAGFASANQSTLAVRAASQVIIFGALTLSFIHVVMIALQRLCAIIFPHVFARKFTPGKCCALIITMWIVSVMYSVTYVYSETFGVVACYQTFTVGFGLIIIYCLITYKTRTNKTDTQCARRQSRVQSKQNRRIFFHSVCVTVVFVACDFPYAINFLFFSNHRAVRKYFYGLLAVRPLLDPLVYFFLYRSRERNSMATASSCHVAPSEMQLRNMKQVNTTASAIGT